MTTTQKIPREALGSLDLREGDTIQVLAVADASFLISISREEPAPPRGSASAWLKSARGSVKLLPGESADDLRSEYYARKYGVER